MTQISIDLASHCVSLDWHVPLCLHSSVVVSTPAYHAADRGSNLGPGVIIRCKNLALYIRDCVSLCLLDETLKAICPFYLVSMPVEVNIIIIIMAGMAVFYVAIYLIEERCRWPVITASPRGKCSK